MKYTVSRRLVLLAMIDAVVLDRSLVYPRCPHDPGIAYGSYDLNRGCMAFLFGCENVSLEYPTKTIFESLSLGLKTVTASASWDATATASRRFWGCSKGA